MGGIGAPEEKMHGLHIICSKCGQLPLLMEIDVCALGIRVTAVCGRCVEGIVFSATFGELMRYAVDADMEELFLEKAESAEERK